MPASERLPQAYRNFLLSYQSWEMRHSAIPDRVWKLASAGSGNPLSLETIWNLDGNEVAFIDQTHHWASVVENDGPVSDEGMSLSLFAGCHSIAEDNGDLLVIDPEGEYAVYLFTHDGLTLEKVSDSIEDFLNGIERTSLLQRRTTQLPAENCGLIGTWKNEDQSLGEELLELHRNGKASRSYDDGSHVVGEWRLEESELVLLVGEPDSLADEECYEVKLLSSNRMRLTDHENDFSEIWVRQEM